MTTTQNLVLREGNDETFDVTFTDPNNSSLPIDITTATIDAWFKNTFGDLDAAAVFHLSTGTGDITILNGPGGIARVTILKTHLALNNSDGSNYKLVWRCDVTKSSLLKTACYGSVTITNL